MDPNACLAEIRAHLDAAEKCGACEQDDMVAEYAQAADKFESLDRWLRTGGFLPSAWTNTCGDCHNYPCVCKPQPDPLDYGPGEVDPFPFTRPEESVLDDDCPHEVQPPGFWE